MKTGFLQEGDIIEIKVGDVVYTDIPEHFAYENRRGVFDRIVHSLMTVQGEFKHLAGTYVVYKTTDVYSDGHHVWCEKLNDPETKVDFYQSGDFTAKMPDIKPVGKAERSWRAPKSGREE